MSGTANATTRAFTRSFGTQSPFSSAAAQAQRATGSAAEAAAPEAFVPSEQKFDRVDVGPLNRAETDQSLDTLKNVAATLLEYVNTVDNRDAKVVEFATPETLKEVFEKAGVPLDLLNQQEPDSDAAKTQASLMKACELTLKYSVKTGNPHFYNQLTARADPIGLAAEWLISAVNSSAFTYEVAPAFTIIEKEVLAKMAQLVGPSFDQHEGLFVPGGSYSNIYAMLMARQIKRPEARAQGVGSAEKGGRLVAFVSDQSHYSYLKAAILTGIGEDNLIKVASDHAGRMRMDSLREEVAKAKAAGHTPFFIGATAGSTVYGAFDPIKEMAQIAKDNDTWFHVDGAWGGSVLLSQKSRYLVEGVEEANSVSWNPHKLLSAPIHTSLFVTRHPGLLLETCGSKAAYLFQADKNNGDLDLGDKTIQCGRRGDAMKVWLMFKAYGEKGLRDRVDRSIALAKYTEQKVNDSANHYPGNTADGAFSMAAEMNFSNVCFNYVPKCMRPYNAETASDEDKARLHKVAPILKDRMQREGAGMITYQPNHEKGLPNFWRLVFASSWNVAKEDVDELLSRMDRLGADIVV